MDFFEERDSLCLYLVEEKNGGTISERQNIASRTGARETKGPLLATQAVRSAAVWAFHQGQYTMDFVSFTSM